MHISKINIVSTRRPFKKSIKKPNRSLYVSKELYGSIPKTDFNFFQWKFVNGDDQLNSSSVSELDLHSFGNSCLPPYPHPQETTLVTVPTDSSVLTNHDGARPGLYSCHSLEFPTLGKRWTFACCVRQILSFKKGISWTHTRKTHIFQKARLTSNKMVHKKRNLCLAQLFIPFHLVWSVLLRVLASKTTSFWLAVDHF